MLLEFTLQNEILGFYFDLEQAQEYQVRGCIEERSITMWLYQGDAVDAVIQGEFPVIDPRNPLSSEPTIDVMVGLLVEKNTSEVSAVYLRLAGGTAGTMQNRFRIAGVSDDRIILNASQQFLAAIAGDDRSRVTEMIDFPLEFRKDNGDLETIQSPEAFLAQYDSIFDAAFKLRLERTSPNYLRAQAGNFIGLIGLSVNGGGGIVFDDQGKVVAIYAWVKHEPTPIAIHLSTPGLEPTISPLCGSVNLGTPGTQELNDDDAPPVLLQGTAILCINRSLFSPTDYDVIEPFREAMLDLDSGFADIEYSDIAFSVDGSGDFSSLWPVNGARAVVWSLYWNGSEVEYPPQPTYLECRDQSLDPNSSDEEPAYMCVVTNDGYVARLKVEAFSPVPSIRSLEISFVTWSHVISPP